MILFLCAQDLHRFWIGLIRDGGSVKVMEEQAAPPERYLSVIDHFLKSQEVTLDQLSGISLVTGPGSFTSTRVSLTIANALHFGKKIPLYVQQNPERLHPEQLLKQQGIGEALPCESYASAAYDRPAHITRPRGDKSLES